VTDISKRLQGALMRIRGDHPFFGTLALFAELRESDDIATAGTDGQVIWFNPAFVESLDSPRLCGLVVHELLHVALQHGLRRRERDPKGWNIAADIVVNGMVRKDTSYELPKGGVELPALAHLSVEEVYEQLQSGRKKAPTICMLDLLPDVGASGSLAEKRHADMQHHWRAALQQASAVARRIRRGFGHMGLDEVRDIQDASQSRLDWRELLWQFMVSTPFDFGGFDRRFIHRKLYLEDVVSESVQVAVCIDTSGSIQGEALGAFIAEVRGILDAYPQIRGHLFFADVDLYGPHDFGIEQPIPKPMGGGGTSFVPFFEWASRQEHLGSEIMHIYLSDGYGVFPTSVPSAPVLWVVCPGGRNSFEFPFGKVVRMGC
jgi:predicted metal-dependent peptidase